ncbi:glucose dehydrogenase [FAD, quinone]-like [Belonocnema kinseyi]|uniref:glucose dehydrogenase [FAD, quinone]-like n=1 Tax=Belonocnema kinseyi TaxID=2817044 RepID=UPI00143D88BC|nr:glucose dehydrogenase [FAD, quinone]-like [Belonocnema kinseyi]XP_033213298.1 glucose dehydrogenase [FAD, quinone]-like [Belonocnema kinseyi]XP_033213299.1 glucose dehydrogenase [FAD, quinone]-like [Belonocnema kinseyi]XP_033213300.1 glucose dehydrogenase [FAD, quinone]-like [Belonocnema kinseyi]
MILPLLLPSLLPYIPRSCAANYCTCMTTIFATLTWVFWPEDVEFSKHPKIRRNVFDIIVVGGGSAGCVLGNRLSEIEEWNVLLLEAGGEEPLTPDIPGFCFQLEHTAIDWNYTTQPEEESCLMNNGCSLPAGKVLGGSSTMNRMMYIRGNKYDYNRLKEMGIPGWSYEEVLPYFKKSEDNKDPKIVEQSPHYHATGGNLSVSTAPFLYPSGKIIEKAFNEIGYPTIDINGESQIGITLSQTTIDNGVRESANAAFIRPIRGTRPNLVVRNNIYVTRILINPVSKRAFGVECKSSPTGPSHYFYAKKEVIVSAGTIGSPRLLMNSGVGLAEELEKHGIQVIKNLSVGKNLQDHIHFNKIAGIRKNSTPDDNIDKCKENVENFIYYAETQQGFYSAPTPVLLTGFFRTEYEEHTDVPDIQFILSLSDKSASQFSLFLALITPMSRGFIQLNATNPVWGPPLIYTRYLTADLDLKRFIQGIRIALSIFDTKIMKENNFVVDDTPIPPCGNFTFNTDEYWTCVLRHFASSFYHPVGTCKMGPRKDSEAVVDPRLRVYGIRNLRVIDASVMTFVPKGNTNAPVIMYAEKASDMIKEDWLGKMNYKKK